MDYDDGYRNATVRTHPSATPTTHVTAGPPWAPPGTGQPMMYPPGFYPGYGYPQQWLQPPPPARGGLLNTGMDLGKLVKLGLLGYAALRSLPAQPNPVATGYGSPDVQNAVTYATTIGNASRGSLLLALLGELADDLI